MHLDTALVQFESAPGDPHRPSSTPIYQTATFEQASALECGAYDYTRSGNPTRAALEAQLARIEGARRAFAFTSGMAAVAALVRTLPAGARILAGSDLYGGTVRLLERSLPRSGIGVDTADASDLDALRSALRPETRLVLVESPTNPLLEIADLSGVAEIARAHGALLAVDGSLMSPLLQRPLELGAHVVAHSATKHLAGHGDVMAGVLATNDEALAAELAFAQNAEGAGLAPFDCWLVLRGLETLAVRLERAQRNAARLAEMLDGHPAVTRVRYPGLAGHPGALLHARQARGAGSVLAFETGCAERSRRVVESTRLFRIAVSFGGAASRISLPGRMSHASLAPGSERARRLPPDLVRVAAGLEDADDLVEDLARALEAAVRSAPVRRLGAT